MTEPPERSETIRGALRAALRDGELTARELSEQVGISERDVSHHLEHLQRASGHGERLVVRPARCGRCGFEFKKRRKLTRPSRCPVCRGERIQAPRFALSGP